MLIEDVIGGEVSFSTKQALQIVRECSDFLKVSGHLPLYKALPSTYQDFQKVKVRKKQSKNIVNEVFNHAFQQEFPAIAQRAIYCYAYKPQLIENTDLFYVFPKNGFKFLYSTEVENSTENFKQVIETLLDSFEDQAKVVDIVSDVVRYTYSHEKLFEGILSKSEIILYNVPYYYAVRVKACLDYSVFTNPYKI